MSTNLPTYNANDLFVRRAVAASGIVKLAVVLAKQARTGSVDIAKQKLLEMCTSQFEYIRSYQILKASASSLFTPTGNTGADETTTLTINGVVVSDTFTVTSDNLVTATNLVNAMNSYTSTPEYTPVLVGSEVHITAVTPGTGSNGYLPIYTSVSGNVTNAASYFQGGQDGVLESNNLVTEATLEEILNNISEITGCGYAPLGTVYTPA